MAGKHGLPLLKQIMGDAQADPRPVFASERMRFALEIAAAGKSLDKGLAALRGRIEALVGTSRFTLEPVFADQADEESYFFVFSPDGVDRTLPDTLIYSIAHDLRVALDLISCEPDTGAAFYPVPEPDRALMAEGAIVEAFCLADSAVPEPKDWAINVTKVPAAWAKSPGRGAGIVIAQPDTGIARHNELEGISFDLTRALNLIEGGTDPTDPLTSQMSNPGHGTGTASVLASPDTQGAISGAAPGATIVPIRCINDVKITDPLPVARAIDHAVGIGAHVITLSLGGFGSRALRRAVRRAVTADVILLAAAGNCIGTVVWPARYSDVIAVGGTNVEHQKWKGSCSGSAVDFSAPAEHVWKAARNADVDIFNGIQASQGTSFSVAISAGIAALWLGHHGRDEVLAEARHRGTTAQALFRSAARQTAHRPDDFPSGLGTGVIDADALLGLALRDINGAQLEAPLIGFADPSDGVESALAEVFGPGNRDPEFDWAAYGSEITSLLFSDIRAGRSLDVHEARAFRQTSPDLMQAAAAARDSRLAHLCLRGHSPAPAVMIPSDVSPDRLARLLSGFGAAAQPGISPESAGAITPEQGQAALDNAGRARALGAFKRQAEQQGADDMIDKIDRDLARLGRDGSAAKLDDMALFQLEALVSLTERPAIAVTERTTPEGKSIQTVDENNPQMGRFAGLVALALPDLETGALASVGRIDGDGVHLGTGWVIGDGLIVTNRHVLEEFAAPLPRLEHPERWTIFRDAVINFSPAGDQDAQSFRITDVTFAGAQPIRAYPISFDKLDLAVLRVERQNTSGHPLPAPIAQSAAGVVQNKELFTVGYPAPPFHIPRDEHGQMRRDVIERLREIFGLQYRQKYFSPGVVMNSAHAWVFDHDSTTLGGNSGSLIGSLSGQIAAQGLHFAGDWLRANHAHNLSAVRAAEPAFAALLT